MTPCVIRFANYVENLGQNRRQQPGSGGGACSGPECPKVAKPELVSDWELVFYRQLWEAGRRLIPQYAEEKFLLDFVLLAEGRKLSIEATPLPFSLNLEPRARAPDSLPGPQFAAPIALGNLLAGVAVDRRLAARRFCTRFTAIARGLPAGGAAGFSLVSTHLLRVSANAARGQQAR